MQTFRGPAPFEEIELAIGPFSEAIVAANGCRVASLRARNAVGYAWDCGCEARGNANPFCVWLPCIAHGAFAVNLEPLGIPPGYEGGVRVARALAPPLKPGDVFVSAAAAIAAAHAVGAAVGYAANGKILREYPDGRREVVSSV